MSYRETRPPRRLERVVQAVWQHDGGGHNKLVLPDGCTDIVFSTATGEAHIAGVMSRAILVPAATGHGSYGVRFEPWAASAVLGVDASTLRDQCPALAQVSPELAQRLKHVRDCESLYNALGPALERARRGFAIDRRLEASVHRSNDAASDGPVAARALDVALSDRHLRRLFLQHVGLGPKAFARVMRFRRALALIDDAATLAAAAAAAGYADQAHFTREARAFSGLSPRALLAATGRA